MSQTATLSLREMALASHELREAQKAKENAKLEAEKVEQQQADILHWLHSHGAPTDSLEFVKIGDDQAAKFDGFYLAFQGRGGDRLRFWLGVPCSNCETEIAWFCMVDDLATIGAYLAKPYPVSCSDCRRSELSSYNTPKARTTAGERLADAIREMIDEAVSP